MFVADNTNHILTLGHQPHCSSRPTPTSTTYFFNSVDELHQMSVNVQLKIIRILRGNYQIKKKQSKITGYPHLLGSLLM